MDPKCGHSRGRCFFSCFFTFLMSSTRAQDSIDQSRAESGKKNNNKKHVGMKFLQTADKKPSGADRYGLDQG